ncbi:14061_t:CDS:2, partial [Entrophospora sp. SA101]
MSALVHFTTDVITDEYGLKYFEDYSSTKFIEIIGIDHCVGFLSFRPPNRKTEINYIDGNFPYKTGSRESHEVIAVGRSCDKSHENNEDTNPIQDNALHEVNDNSNKFS